MSSGYEIRIPINLKEDFMVHITGVFCGHGEGKNAEAKRVKEVHIEDFIQKPEAVVH